MRLLVVTQDFPPETGGIQTYSRDLSAALAARCEFLGVVAPSPPGAAALDSRLPFPVYRLPGRSDLLPAPAMAALPALARRERVEAVLHVQWTTLGAGLLARRLRLVRRVFAAAHGRELLLNLLGPLPALGPGYDRLRSELLGRADGCFPVSRFTGGLLEAIGVPPGRIHVVPNGVDPERLKPGGGAAFRARHGLGTRPVLLTLARLVPRKGVDTVLEALPRIAEEVPDLVYVVAGSGPDLPRLERLAVEGGLCRRVRFIGRLPSSEIADCLSACDLFVMPSRSEPPDVEGFGLVFAEAGACERPVVGAAAGGVPDAVVHRETGLLVPPADPDALARAVLALLKDPAEARRLGRRGRERLLESGTWGHAADRMLEVMRKACASF